MEPLGGRHEITAEWLTEALREGGHLPRGRVSAVEVNTDGIGIGYISETVRIVPTYEGADGTAPASLVAKLPVAVDFPEYLKPWAAQAVETELHFYPEAGGDCAARVPACYGAAFEGWRSYALLLEDLSHLESMSQMDSGPRDRADAIVTMLGALHAQWWESDRLRAASWLPSPEWQSELNTPLVEGGWEMFAEQVVPRVDPDFMPVGERVVRDFAGIFERGAASAATLVHGDFRIENFLFGQPGTPDEIVFIDWQLSGYGSGLRDMAYFVSQGFDPDERREVEDDLIATYHASLVEYGVSGYSLAQCHEDYRLGLLWSLYAPIIGMTGMAEREPPPPDAPEEEQQAFREMIETGVALVTVMAERNIRAVMDTKAGELLGA
ncbi:MAG: phosphotransferase [Chloroflexi bacterium]|nr:phosphotransferase [Chloroflexota bacterium]